MALSRRTFLFFCSCGLAHASALAGTLQAPARRQVTVGGQRVRTIDMHAHVFINEAWPLVKDFPQTDKAMASLGASTMAIDTATMDRRFREMDRIGIDVHVISVHPSQFLYFLEPDLSARIVRMQNEKIAELVKAHPDRFVGLCGRRLLVFPPAQDPMLNWLRAALGDLGKIDHLLHLAVVVDVEEIEGPTVLDLLAVASGTRPGDVVGQGAHVRGLALGRRLRRGGDLLDDHGAAPSPLASRRMAACSAFKAAAVSRL